MLRRRNHCYIPLSESDSSSSESSSEDGSNYSSDSDSCTLADDDEHLEDAQRNPEEYDLFGGQLLQQPVNTQTLLLNSPLPPLDGLAGSTLGEDATTAALQAHRDTLSGNKKQHTTNSTMAVSSRAMVKKSKEQEAKMAEAAAKSPPASDNNSLQVAKVITNTVVDPSTLEKTPHGQPHIVSQANSAASGSESSLSAGEAYSKKPAKRTTKDGDPSPLAQKTLNSVLGAVTPPNGGIAPNLKPAPGSSSTSAGVSDKPAKKQKQVSGTSTNAAGSTSKAAGLNPKSTGAKQLSGTKRKPAATNAKKRTVEQVNHANRKKLELFCANHLANDKKMNLQVRLNELTKVRRTNYVTEFNLGRITKKLAKVQAAYDNAILREQSLKGELDVANQKNSVQVARSKATLLRVCNDQLEKVVDISKNHLWRTRKFISCDEEEMAAADFVRVHMKNLELTSMEQKVSWVETYKRPIKKAFFARRNYVTSEIKKLVSKHFLNKGLPMPTLAQILACATRTIDVNVPEQMDMFMFYWETILPKMVGSKAWDRAQKYYTTITKAKVNDNSHSNGKGIITSTSEAMVVLIWENNAVRWPYLHEWSAQDENRGKTQPPMNGVYTFTDGGQNEWGAWKEKGLEAFNTYTEQIKLARKSSYGAQLERITLQRLRIRVGIDQPDHDTHQRIVRAKKRRKKMNSEEAQEDVSLSLLNRVVKTIADSDEEDEPKAQVGADAEDFDDDETDMEVSTCMIGAVLHNTFVLAHRVCAILQVGAI